MRTTATSEALPGYRVDPVSGAWLTIPWPSDPIDKETLIASSLGPQIIDWAEWRTDEPGLTDYLTGKPWRFTPGQQRFLILWYAYDERGRWLYRSGVKRGAKGTGKDPFGAAPQWMPAPARSLRTQQRAEDQGRIRFRSSHPKMTY